jgi:hypothetical protein
MKPQELSLRKRPFVFLTRAALSIVVFTLIPSLVTLLVGSRVKEDFYIRTGNSSQPLSVSKAAWYGAAHFSGV